MAGCGRRLAVRAGSAAAVAALALSWSAVVTEAAGSPVEITVHLGYHDAVKLGQWMPIEVDVTNHGAQVDGTLEVDGSNSFPGKGGPPSGTAIYVTPLSLAPGATKHVRTYVSQDFPGSVRARVVQGGQVIASQEKAISTTVNGLLVGVVSDQSSAFDGIATIHPGGVSPTVEHLAGSDLSDSGLILRAFDLIAIDDFSTDTLTTGQRGALVDYVMQGGSLLLGTGGSWHKTLAGLPSAIVPMQVTGTTVLGAASSFGGESGIEVATGAVSAGATPWLTQGDRPLIVEAMTGSGLVELSTFDWAQSSVATLPQGTDVLRQLVVRSTLGSPGGSVATSGGGLGGGITNSVASRGGTLSQALGNVPALDLPAWWLIGGLVLVYILLVGPVNYFVLRALGRRALAWVTVPVIALIASGGAYGASVATKGTSVVANEISIVHIEPGWDRSYNEDYTGIVAPTRGDYAVAVGGPSAMISPIYYFNNTGDPNLGAMRVNTATGGVVLPSMSAFTLRAFAEETMGAAPSITGLAQLKGGQLVGTIKNLSSVTFTDGVVIAGNNFQKIGELAPGASATFSVTPAATGTFTGNPVAYQIYGNGFCCGGPSGSTSDADRENQARLAILSTLTINGYGNLPVSAVPTVALWTKQPFQRVSVNGAHPRTYVEGAVVMALPVGTLSAGALPTGLVPARLVDLDAGLTSGGPPGLVVVTSGSLTYSFAPNLAGGTHLTSVQIGSSNVYGPKFAAGGGAANVKGQVWDWATSTWTAIGYQDGGTTSVPDSAVNPVTGEVRLKVSSDGPFTAGFLSISGTVK